MKHGDAGKAGNAHDSGMATTLTAAQLRDALEFCNPDGPEDTEQMETEVTFFYREQDEISTDGDPLPRGWYCYLTEYPDEGAYGPLGEHSQATAEQEASAEPLEQPESRVFAVVVRRCGECPAFKGPLPGGFVGRCPRIEQEATLFILHPDCPLPRASRAED